MFFSKTKSASARAASEQARSPAERMDRLYGYTRHVYDASRRFYLFGRDRLLDRIPDEPPLDVLEVGCGTGRNLRVLAERAPKHRLYGLDASKAMLETARSKAERDTRRNGPRSNGRSHGDQANEYAAPSIYFTQGLAEELDPRDQFGRDDPFDVIFFSYALSMMPDWRAALEAALEHVARDGRIYIVDFWDQDDLPDWFAGLLTRWLRLFGVEFRPELHAHLYSLEQQGRCRLRLTSIGRRYAYLAELSRPGPES